MSEEIPMWLRALDVLVGIILVVLGIWVIWGIIDPTYLIGVTLMQLLGIILIIWAGVFAEGIKYDIGTGWIPTFSWSFAIFSWITFIIFMIIPHMVISVILFRKFKGIFIRKRIKRYVFSVFLKFFIVMLVILYNTWTDNTIYRTVYLIIVVPSSFIAAYFVYKAFVQGLE